jgi:hypothetical protein
LLQAKGNALETLQKTGIIDWALGVACSEELFAAPRKMLKNNERASTVLLQLFASSRRKICGVEVENKVEISKQPRNKENDSHSSLVMLLSSGILTAEKRKKSVFCQTLKKKTKKGGPPCTDDSPSSIGSKAFLARPRRERARAYFAFVDNWLLGNEASEGKKSAKPRRAKLRSQTMTEVGQCALIDWFGEVLSLLANHEEATSIVEEHTGDRRMTDEEGHHHLHFQLTTSNKSASKEDSALPVPVQGIAPPPRVVVRRRRRRPKRAINLRHLLIASNTAGILSLLLATGILVNIQLSHPTGSVLRLYNGLSFGLTIFAAISLMLIPSAIQNARRRAAELAAIAAQQLLNAEVHPPGAGEQQRRREVFPALVTLVDDDGGEGQNNRATFQGVCAVCLTELRETPPETRIIRVNTCGVSLACSNIGL